MINFITKLPINKAAMAVGITFITSVIIVSLVDDVLLPNFVVPGDTAALARDIEANGSLFGIAVAAYLLVLLLDSMIALALYVVLKPANHRLAQLTALFRLLYAGTVALGLFALSFHITDVYGYEGIKKFGYIFFALHILILGYSVIKSGYMPKSIGLLLIVASFTYIVFFVDLHLPELLEVVIMLTMALAELSLSIWLMVKRNSLPANNNQEKSGGTLFMGAEK